MKDLSARIKNRTILSFLRILRRLPWVFSFLFTGSLTAQTNYFRVIDGIPHIPEFANAATVIDPQPGMLIYSAADAKPVLYTGVDNGWQDLCTSGVSTTTTEDFFKISGGIPYIPFKISPTGTFPISGSILYSTVDSAVMVYSGSAWLKVSEMSAGTFTASTGYFESYGDDLKTCKIPVLASDPTPAGPGALYINSTSNAIVFYDGSAWQYVVCAPLPLLTTTAVTNITQTTATSGGNVTSDGGSPVTARGVCWSTSQNPTISDNHSTDGAGTGIFVSSLTGLTPGTLYYVRAYATNGTETFYGNEESFTTLSGFTCGSSITITHVAGTVAPVSKTVTYGIVTNIPGEPLKCWITSNLGADHQATAVDDATEASAGWYWQFNRKQGYKHDGITRTPNTTWIDYINENLDWQPANDPCALELGSSWRLPTYIEWDNVNTMGGWTDWTGPWSSGLKLHGAGLLENSDGSLFSRGSYGNYWSNTQDNTPSGWIISFQSYAVGVANAYKAYGLTLRCLRDPTSPSAIPTVTTNSVTNITQTTATSGGDVTSDGGTPVTARGVCWSTSQYPTISDSHTTDGAGTGIFTSAISGLIAGTTYYVRAYATNSEGTGYGNQENFTTSSSAFYIGQNYGGGIIFYIDGTGEHGLIAAPSDQSHSASWGCLWVLVGTSTAIGTGLANTTAIVTQCGGAAANVCYNLELNGYSDWFLPSKDELYQMYLQQSVLNGFIGDDYWSSSEASESSAWAFNILGGSQSTPMKDWWTISTRAIRAF